MSDYRDQLGMLELERCFPPGLVAVPVVPWMYTASAQAFIDLSHSLPPGSALQLLAEGPSSIAAARNLIVRVCLQQKQFEWLCMIDSDMLPPPNAVRQLLATGHDIVSGLYFRRASPFLPTATLLPNHKYEGGQAVIEVLRVGLGCILIRRSVIEQMEPPHFRHAVPGVGEDSEWCDRARELGFNIYVDQSLDVGHLAAIPITRELACTWLTSEVGRREKRHVFETVIAASRTDQARC